MAKSKKDKKETKNDYIVNPINTGNNFLFESENDTNTNTNTQVNDNLESVAINNDDAYLYATLNQSLEAEYEPKTNYEMNFGDILIDEDSKAKNSKAQANKEQKTSKINTTDNLKNVEDSDEDLELDEQVKKYEKELVSTRKKLTKYLSKFSDDYLGQIRATDYYKERLAYWKDYYAKRRKDAEMMDQSNNLARQEAMAELQQQNPALSEKQEETVANKVENVKTDNIKENKENQKAENSTEKQTTSNNNINSDDFTVYNIYDLPNGNNDFLKAYGTNFTLTEEDKKNVNNITRADLFIEEIDKRLEKSQNATEKKEPTAEQKAELKSKINGYVTAILLDSMHDVLKKERDESRKLVKKVSTSNKKAAEFLSEKLNEKYNLYSDALASFDNVVTKTRNESKRAAAQREKDADSFSLQPSLLAANDMLVDGLRTTFVNNVAQYMTNRIYNQIEEQNVFDTVYVTKSFVKDSVSQLTDASAESLIKLENLVKQGLENRINKRQQECETLKTQIKNKEFKADELKTAKEELVQKQRQLEYDKFNAKYVLPKQNKLLEKNSVDFIISNVISNEMSSVIYKNSVNKLNEYNLDKEKAEKISNQIIGILDKSKDAKLNFKLKQEKAEEVKQEEVKEIKEEPKQEQEVKAEPVKEIKPEPISREQFIQDRSEALIYLADMVNVCFFNTSEKDKVLYDFFKFEKHYVADEYLHWDGMVQGIKIKMDKMAEKGEQIPEEYIDFYNENYVPNHRGFNPEKLGYDAIAHKRVVEQEDYEKYAKNYKSFVTIASDPKFVDCIKNEYIKMAVDGLKDTVEQINNYTFCKNHSCFWDELSKNGKVNDKFKPYCEIIKNKLDDEFLTEVSMYLNKNIKYYDQEIDRLSQKVVGYLEILDDYTETLQKLEEIVLKEKSNVQDKEDCLNDYYQKF